MIYYLLFFELQIKRYDLSKFWMKSSLNFYLNLVLNHKPTRGGFLLARTGLDGLRFEAVGSKVDWTDLIHPYPFI
jgi:hypothetical protein